MAKKYQTPYLNVNLGSKYRVIAIPVPVPKEYPPSGSIGEACWTSSWNGACLDINGKKFVVPFDCIEEVGAQMEDAELVAVMLDNPYGVYKLLRGLWRMTKNPTIRNFMECGEIPPDGTELVKRNNKTPADYDKQWKDAEAAGDEKTLLRLEDEAALSGAFADDFLCKS